MVIVVIIFITTTKAIMGPLAPKGLGRQHATLLAQLSKPAAGTLAVGPYGPAGLLP